MIDEIKRILVNSLGWRTKRKIVVFESDDWGSIRMASKEAYKYFLLKGYSVDQCAYNRNDMMESNTDMEGLMEVLSTYRDRRGKPANFTLNNVVANPDFEKIRASDFQKYYFEPFTDTLARYPNHDCVYDLQIEGKEKELFSVQFHGREHVNIYNWLGHLKANDVVTHEAFTQNMFSVHHKLGLNARDVYLETYGLGFGNQAIDHYDDVVSGLKLFKDIWGFSSKTMIAPNCVWDSRVEEAAFSQGIEWMQGVYVQLVPNHLKNNVSIKRHYLGKRSKVGLRYLTRNVFFEPSSESRSNWLEYALKAVDVAFTMNKPAIIASHRVNYIGGLNEENRSKNLKLLGEFLATLIKKYPEIEFMSSNELGNLINK